MTLGVKIALLALIVVIAVMVITAAIHIVAHYLAVILVLTLAWFGIRKSSVKKSDQDLNETPD